MNKNYSITKKESLEVQLHNHYKKIEIHEEEIKKLEFDISLLQNSHD